ncbi:MAG TPA: tryptophan-rich sensory protein [Actinomycetales bacterium]|nr:tryptophan-rich sensory protein [Actinomycetales bacterium]
MGRPGNGAQHIPGSTSDPGTVGGDGRETVAMGGGGADRTARLALVTGATGYIGGRLVPELLNAGYRVRVMVRDPRKVAARPWADRVEVSVADALDATATGRALEGIDVAYYLLHALGTGPDFADRELSAASIFGQEARRQRVGRIVYLGGLHPGGGEELSPHLRSRRAVGRALLDSGVPTAVLQAGVIIGSGSASFEMLRYLTERLPWMVTPKWVDTATQPIAVRDVLRYLVLAASLPTDVSRTFDIGGEEVMTYRAMMQRYAEVAGLPPRQIVRVPLLSVSLSSHWVGLVTPVPASIARPLVDSLVHEAVVKERDLDEFLPADAPPPAVLRPSGRSRPGEGPRHGRRHGLDVRLLPRGAQQPAPRRPDVVWRLAVRGRKVHGGRRRRRHHLAGGGGVRWPERLVLLAFGLVGAWRAGPAGGRAGPSTRPAPPTPTVYGRRGRLVASGGRSARPESPAAGRDAAARPSLAGAHGRTGSPGAQRPSATSRVPPARSGRPPLLGRRHALPPDRLRRHAGEHGPRGGTPSAATPATRGASMATKHLTRTAAGVTAAAVLGSLGTDVRSTWYRDLRKPSWQPPGAVFGPVWTTLYALIALGGARALDAAPDEAERTRIARGLATNLTLNAGWNWLFFRARRPRLAFIELVLLLVSTFRLTRRAARVDAGAGRMLTPYLVWTSFAAALNADIARRNRDT